MFHESGVTLPKGVGTSTPDEVAAAVVSAIVKNRAEVDVAPVALRAGAAFAQIAPEVSARLSRRLGSDRVAQDMATRQSDRR
jgi:hypothetical protein